MKANCRKDCSLVTFVWETIWGGKTWACFLVSAQSMSGRMYKKLEASVARGDGNRCLNSRVGGRLYSIPHWMLCHVNALPLGNHFN